MTDDAHKQIKQITEGETMRKDIPESYEILREENLPDIHSQGTLLRHRKTGARVMLIENDDENKVFNIAFRTTPKDSEYLPERHDLPGQDLLSGSQLQ